MMLSVFNVSTKSIEQSLKIQIGVFREKVNISYTKSRTKIVYTVALDWYNSSDIINTIEENVAFVVKNAID